MPSNSTKTKIGFHIYLNITNKVVKYFFQLEKFNKRTCSSLISLFNGISTFVGYLMPEPSFKENSSGAI